MISTAGRKLLSASARGAERSVAASRPITPPPQNPQKPRIPKPPVSRPSQKRTSEPDAPVPAAAGGGSRATIRGSASRNNEANAPDDSATSSNNLVTGVGSPGTTSLA